MEPDSVRVRPAYAITKSALKHARTGRYLRPSPGRTALRDHFLWADLYADVATLSRGRKADTLVIALRELMEHLQLRPVHKLVGELGGRRAMADVSDEVQANRLDMQTAMQEAKTMLPKGWLTTTGGARSNGTLYMWRSDVKLLNRIWASTSLTPGTFRLWVETTSKKSRGRLAEQLSETLGPLLQARFGHELHPAILVERAATKYPAVDIRLPLQTLLSGVKTRSGVGKRLGMAMEVVASANVDALGAQ